MARGLTVAKTSKPLPVVVNITRQPAKTAQAQSWRALWRKLGQPKAQGQGKPEAQPREKERG